MHVHLVEVGTQLQQPHRAARLGDRVEQHVAQHAQHGGPLDLQVGVHGRDEALEVVVEPQHVEVLDVGVGVTQLERRRVAHRADRDALAALPRAQQRRDKVSISRDEDRHVEGLRQRSVVKHVHSEGDVDALLLPAREAAEMHFVV